MVWSIENVDGDAGAFHARVPRAQHGRQAWFSAVSRPTLVLGSAQAGEAVDTAVVRALGAEVVQRRSGGAAVLLLPGEFVWLDLVVPRGDPLWHDDIGRSMHWAGELWADALGALGVDELSVHRGAMQRTLWSGAVCFAGLGPGEVTRGAGKIVGISQRRTRDWARLQTMAHLRWRPELVAALVAGPARPTARELASVCTPVDSTVAALTAALESALPTA